jgi:hypothetical protein
MISINNHEILLDSEERLEPWASFDRVIWLAMDFIKRCPSDPRNGLPWYLQYSCFWTDPLRPTIWPDNPAGKFAWAVSTLIRYYPYSGDADFIEIVAKMLDRLIAYHTPSTFEWGNVPYASAEPGTGVYFGARADGAYVTEPDKIAQAACAYLDFYKLTGKEKYSTAALSCADTLCRHMRPGNKAHSPWPFRVAVRDGAVIEEYSSDVIQMVRLFDALIRLGQTQYLNYRDAAWEWILKAPLRTQIWKGYFEDIRLDPQNQNREQLSCLETARFMLHNPTLDPDWREHVPAMIDWVHDTLGAQPFYSAVPIHEQKFCYFVMGSHTARFASLSALWAKASGDSDYRQQAIRSFNWATYMANEDGTVTVGIDRPDYYNQCWFTDGYFDYVPHFLDGMAAMPEFAPAEIDHLLNSTSIVKDISYSPLSIRYSTFDEQASETLRLTFQPISVSCGGDPLSETENPISEDGWSFDTAHSLLKISHSAGDVEISGR